MAKKYKVCADEQFLGHFHGTSPEAAVEKAIRKNFIYHPEIIGMTDCDFVAQKGILEQPITLSWSDMPDLAVEFEIPTEE